MLKRDSLSVLDIDIPPSEMLLGYSSTCLKQSAFAPMNSTDSIISLVHTKLPSSPLLIITDKKKSDGSGYCT